jgi:Peptidase inhibitor family I36
MSLHARFIYRNLTVESIMRRVFVVLAAVAAATLVAPASPAQAFRDGTCGAGDFCVFNALSFQTNQGWADVPNAVASWSALDSHVVNKDSSWRNRFSGPIAVYNGANYAGGVEVCINAGVARSAGVLSLWDDDGQSNHNLSACP